jgi:hypothetical protein
VDAQDAESEEDDTWGAAGDSYAQEVYTGSVFYFPSYNSILLHSITSVQ